MHANSSPVSSNQKHTHPALPGLLRRHLASRWQKPIAEHNRRAFDQLQEALAARPRPLVLDSYCGTGYSTARLAERYSDHLVVGVDKSAQRLARHVSSGGDYLLLRAECEPFWLQMVAEGLAVEHHYLFYPNPWPKSVQMKRRVHGHPAFPLLLALGGSLELRSNWQLYVEEFGLAVQLAGGRGWVNQLAQGASLTLFEEKYRNSGHTLWQYRGRTPTESP